MCVSAFFAFSAVHKHMWQTYFQPTTFDDALHLLAEHGAAARLVAGGTDIVVELQRGVRPTATLIDISRVAELRYVREQDEQVRLGALATHNDVIASQPCVARALPLAQACWEVGAPQIRTRATVAGNLVTASPANDTITPLIALGAEVVLASASGERVVALGDFYQGVRRTALVAGELLREIRIPALGDNQRGLFLKLGLRRAQAISVINVALVVTLDGDAVTAARIALGCVAPTVIRTVDAEAFLIGKTLTADVCAEAGQLAANAARPIDDLRGSAHYRLATVAALVAQGLERIAADQQADGWPSEPVLLETRDTRHETRGAAVQAECSIAHRLSPIARISTTVNGVAHEWTGASNKTLLDALREEGGLTGTKEGCAEGECGACTVWLGGQAVMACLVPAVQAHAQELTTIEGLAASQSPTPNPQSQLHPLQQAFIAHGAVQCGYCIPGMLMAGAKLLQEHPDAERAQAQVALSGNICRCTGYRKIFDAVLAARSEKEHGV